MPDQENVSQTGLDKANKVQAQFSGHGRSRGAAGFMDPRDEDINVDHLGKRGDTLSITPGPEGFGTIAVAAAWDNPAENSSVLGKILNLKADADLDLGCLYELHDGQRGAIQALGNLMGNFKDAPFMKHSGDEQTGDTEGDDELIRINGAEWSKIKRLLFYVYIYKGVSNWAECRPQVQLRVPGQKPMVVTIASSNDQMDICAIAGIENVRNGIKLTNYTEYFPGQAEMDRAFGFGIEWTEVTKRSS